MFWSIWLILAYLVGENHFYSGNSQYCHCHNFHFSYWALPASTHLRSQNLMSYTPNTQYLFVPNYSTLHVVFFTKWNFKLCIAVWPQAMLSLFICGAPGILVSQSPRKTTIISIKMCPSKCLPYETYCCPFNSPCHIIGYVRDSWPLKLKILFEDSAA